MGKKVLSVQFSIYKVEYLQSKEYFEQEKDIEIQSFEELEENIFAAISNEITEKNGRIIYSIEYKNFKGIVFKTKHHPIWDGMISQIIKNSQSQKDIYDNSKIEIANEHISYILAYLKECNIFLLTGGLGSNYITEYIQKNYGLYLLPKLMGDSSPVIKTVLENSMTGNRLSSMHANRNATTINVENDMSLIFRELSLEVGNDITKELGIVLDSTQKQKNININAKDSLVVRKSLSIDELEQVLNCLIKIEKKDDNFSLGYFIDVKKQGHTYQEMNNYFINDILGGKIDNYILIGNEYARYCIAGASYRITDNDGEIILEQSTPITMKELYQNFLSDSITKNKIEKVMRYKLSVYDVDNNIILSPTRIKECIQGFSEDNNRALFFLYNGSWLMFDIKYLDFLNEEYQKAYQELTKLDKNLIFIMHSHDTSLTEDKYNLTFRSSDKVILAHTVKCENIEIADFIYYDDKNLYLIHNKQKFDGAGTRDVFNQIIVSSEFISNYLLESDRRRVLSEYYRKIKEKYPENEKTNSITQEEFVNLFSELKINYVAAFMTNLSDKTKSNYAQYIVLNTNKKLINKNHKLFLLDIKS